jgi:hypothetical protein
MARAIPRPPSHLISAPVQMVAAEAAPTVLRETRGREEPEVPLSLTRTISRQSSQSRPSPSGALRAAPTAPGRREKGNLI